tara:strand:+ start:20 stop:298 length:279 start_codon:yes stop_codon:yes gene_type:complete
MAFKQRSQGSSFKMMGSSPAKHGKFEDFQHGRKGHNPDTMSAKHEDFHAKQSDESPTKDKNKGKGGFMHPPYKKPVGPTEKHHYVHGYKKTK